jgi:hypothetical protein
MVKREKVLLPKRLSIEKAPPSHCPHDGILKFSFSGRGISKFCLSNGKLIRTRMKHVS